jgi:hypothetical protein
MTCRCQSCKKGFSTGSELLEHIISGPDSAHEKWMESYCDSKKIDYARLILERLNGNEAANKPVIAALKKDFCEK